MKRPLLWRGVLIGVVVLLALLAAYPLDKIKLGLDLRGGMHLVLEVQTQDALRSETDKDMERIRQQMIDAGHAQVAGNRLTNTSFELTGLPAAEEKDLVEAIKSYLPEGGWDWRRNGERYVFEMAQQNLKEIQELSVRQAQDTIETRVNQYGVSEPVIHRQGLEGNRIVVQLPGVDDPERVKALIKNTAFLEFRLVDYPAGGGGSTNREEVLRNYGAALPDNLEILTGEDRAPDGTLLRTIYYAVTRSPVITGRDLKTARPSQGEFNQPIVSFFLTHDGGRRFGRATGDNVGRGLAIVLDGRVVSAPVIRSRIGDSGIIEGSFTQQEVEDLSMQLRSGALPAGITYLEERTVGPSLGRDSIDRGLRAGWIGLSLVVLLMLIVYRRTGINAITALTINIVLIFGALAYFRATLTLPGIAGIVLTIGMAVDANVLIFERIREELHHGRTVRSAIDAGFQKALSSVLDANITTLIAALFLFQFGTGPIRGFAVTLSIGILASLFTAIFVSRWIFDLVLSHRQRSDRLSI